jgi:ATP-dependent Lhr-like helicase
VRTILAEERRWPALPPQVSQWLALQRRHSIIPRADETLIETFPHEGRHFLVAYPFEGRLAHQTLGMLITRRLDRAGATPLGFIASEYALSIWSAGDISAMIADGRIDLARLFEEDMLGDDLDAWMAETSLMKRTFRMCAVIAGLIERRHPGKEKSGRQVTISSDIIYDVLRQHEPGHILLEAAWQDAATGLLDIARLGEFLQRARGRIRHKGLSRCSPLAVPVLIDIGREQVGPRDRDWALRALSAEHLLEEALGDGDGARDVRE